VDYVDPGSPADLQAGLEPGDVIVRINGRIVRNQSEFVNVINNSGGFVRLLIRNVRGGGLVTVGVDLGLGRIPIDPPPPLHRWKHR
jgi:S1-C subfamily serine protease